MSTDRARNTVETYASAWKAFEKWCSDVGREPLPADAETCLLFATWCLTYEKLKLSTIHIRICAINRHHRLNGFEAPRDKSITEFFQNARREVDEESGAKLPVSAPLLRFLMGKLKGEHPHEVRDRSIILAGFSSGWRRSELAGLNLSDVTFVDKGMVLKLRRSKNDQQGRGRIVGIQYGRRRLTCPVRALKAWIELRGSWHGPLFTGISQSGQISRKRMCTESMCRVLKRVLDEVGEDSKEYGMHSLRSGMVTTSIEDGASETMVMQRTGHKSYQSLKRYVRPAKAFFGNPLAKAL